VMVPPPPPQPTPVEEEGGEEKPVGETESGETTPPVQAPPPRADELVRVGEPILLQQNLHAEREFKDHTIVWDWMDYEDEDADKYYEKWGHNRNGEFVRGLRGGDEIRVVMNCRYPGWSCEVDKCEVKMFWAV